MPTVFDVAAYILDQMGSMTAMKLQKLVYYSQAWSLVWDERPLFKSKIEAWANGPVSPDLYKAHRKMYKVTSIEEGDHEKLSAQQKHAIDRVLKFYGPKPAQWLSDLSHRETPWKAAREGLVSGEIGSEEITHAAMAEYYGSL